jgi:cell division cycle 14
MPHSPRPSKDDVPSVTSYGQVIEYIESESSPTHCSSLSAHIATMAILTFTDRLYLASYTHAPDEKTPFPYPAPRSSRSPHKRSSRAHAGPQSASSSVSSQPPRYFSIDRSLLYNAFHADFGPLHIGHLYRFAVTLHEVLGDPDNENRPVVFWSHADSRSASRAIE